MHVGVGVRVWARVGVLVRLVTPQRVRLRVHVSTQVAVELQVSPLRGPPARRWRHLGSFLMVGAWLVPAAGWWWVLERSGVGPGLLGCRQEVLLCCIAVVAVVTYSLWIVKEFYM